MKTEAPLCECHGLPKRWAKDARRKVGGRWRCAEKGRAYSRVASRKHYWSNPEKVRERVRIWQTTTAMGLTRYDRALLRKEGRL